MAAAFERDPRNRPLGRRVALRSVATAIVAAPGEAESHSGAASSSKNP